MGREVCLVGRLDCLSKRGGRALGLPVQEGRKGAGVACPSGSDIWLPRMSSTDRTSFFFLLDMPGRFFSGSLNASSSFSAPVTHFRCTIVPVHATIIARFFACDAGSNVSAGSTSRNFANEAATQHRRSFGHSQD